MSKMIERALEVEMEKHREHIARVMEEITAQVTAQVDQQVAKQLFAQMHVYEAKIRALVAGSRVVTSEPEVTDVMAPTRR
jgi:transcriptional regulator CtsR